MNIKYRLLCHRCGKDLYPGQDADAEKVYGTCFDCIQELLNEKRTEAPLGKYQRFKRWASENYREFMLEQMALELFLLAVLVILECAMLFVMLERR